MKAALAVRVKGDVAAAQQRLQARVWPSVDAYLAVQRMFLTWKDGHQAAVREPPPAATENLKAQARDMTQALFHFRLTAEPA